MRQVIHATIVGLASHPMVQNSGLFLPIVPGEPPQPVKVQRWRAYAGYELSETGLVCSVYPVYTSRITKGSAISTNKTKAVEVRPYTMGSRGDATAHHEATYTIIVEAMLTDVGLGTEATVQYDLLQSASATTDAPPFTPHGLNYRTRSYPIDLAETDLDQHQPTLEGIQRIPQSISFDVDPSEELLREFMDVLRLALDDMPNLTPFTIRSSQVKSIDYPTTAWSSSSNILFHSAYLIWELSLYPPASWKDIYFLPVSTISIKNQEPRRPR